ncbi:MAG: hypothetical protein AAFX75_14555 [Pseudomonadota bacterium]
MLTDIFAFRYADVPIWEEVGKSQSRLIIQAWRIVNENIFPKGHQDKETDSTEAQWKLLHDKLSTELGLQELAKRHDGYHHDYLGQRRWVNFTRTWRMMCEQFVCANYDGSESADDFIKNRLSFVEIAFREREQALAIRRARGITSADELITKLLGEGEVQKPMSVEARTLARLQEAENSFRAYVDELNTRFRQSRSKLHYHNGYIQVSGDDQITQEIEEPFWVLVSDAKWKNVETDMAEAVDRRDTGRRDPAFPAAKALESTIKIISSDKGWTRGNERGASSFISNLVSKENGRFIDVWESEALTHFFSKVRNELGHGPGDEPMPDLSLQQTNWAIQFCMSWIRSLIDRM